MQSKPLVYMIVCSLIIVLSGCEKVEPEEQAECEQTTSVLMAMQNDAMFTQPYIDQDEWRDKPVRHRYVHGGFEGTQLKFSYYLPPKEQYDGRFFQYITPVPDSETVSQGATGEDDKIGFSLASGAYFVETNGGGRHLAMMGGDPTVGGYRANAAAAQYSRIVAMAMYGCQRPYGYAFGGSGGGYRTIGGMENTDGVWDGAVPYVIGSPMAIPNVFTVRMYALRVLKDKLPAIADAVDVGSGIDPVTLLNEEEARAFHEVTRMGFPLEAWYVHDKLDLHGYAVLFPGIVAMDRSYFTDDFWHKPGYAGFKPSASLQAAKIQHTTTIKQLVMSSDVEELGLEQALHKALPRGLADDAFKAILSNEGANQPVAIRLASVPSNDLLGAEIILTSGLAKGQRLLASHFAGDYILLGGTNPEVVAQLREGDELEVNNLNYLASQTYHRHQVPKTGYPVWDQFRNTGGEPLYPQRPMVVGPIFARGAAGTIPSGHFKGKMIVLSNLYDTEAYPWQGDWYVQAAKPFLGDKLNDHLRLWYTDRSTHGDSSRQIVPTQTVSYLGVLQQALRDVSTWVEKGIEPPASSRYTIVDGQVQVPEQADERRGIQPLVTLLANQGKRAEVAVGEKVVFSAEIAVPENTGFVTKVAWDFDGSGQFAHESQLENTSQSTMVLSTEHQFSEPGTHFAVVKVTTQREGDAATPYTRIYNLDRARVVVR